MAVINLPKSGSVLIKVISFKLEYCFQSDLKFSELQPFWGNYDLLETDYDSYAIIYSCTNLLGGLYRTEYAFVLSREPVRLGTPLYDHILAVT